MYKIFGKANCPGCDLAKKLLEEHGEEYTYVDIVSAPEQRAVMFAAVQQAAGIVPKSVPQVFKDDKYIGGYVQLYASFTSSEDEGIVAN